MNYSCTIVILILLQALACFANNCPGDVTRFKPCHCNLVEGEISISCRDKNMSAVYDMFDRISPEKLNLRYLYIRDNEETKLGENLLKGSKANQVVLRMPSLKYIDADFLKGQDSSMLFVNIIQNDLEDIPNAVIKKLKNLKLFEFNEAKKVRAVVSNGFKGFAGIFSLTKINYAKNSISFLDDNAFAHLKRIESINLSFNKLKFIDQSSFPTRLPHTLILAPGYKDAQSNQLAVDEERITPRYNNLRDLPLDFLVALPQSTTINLVGNKVTYLSREFVRRLIKKNIRINLIKNQLKCGCSMMTLALANRNHMSYQFKGACATPSKLNGLPLANLTSENFPSCSEEGEDLVAVMQAGFNTNINSFVQLNEGEMDKIESTAYEIDNTYNM
ncbi:Oplophorus-luciferin 2-monooxygenase non-catalytic subunit [Nymphon striatum]|nr:Oplophorus-luciferin 2-monooxygenase non-catalytic subunit [Nymphon striatum]